MPSALHVHEQTPSPCKASSHVCRPCGGAPHMLAAGELRLGTSFIGANGHPSSQWKHWYVEAALQVCCPGDHHICSHFIRLAKAVQPAIGSRCAHAMLQAAKRSPCCAEDLRRARSCFRELLFLCLLKTGLCCSPGSCCIHHCHAGCNQDAALPQPISSTSILRALRSCHDQLAVTV